MVGRFWESYIGFGLSQNYQYSTNIEIWRGRGCSRPQYLPRGIKINSWSNNKTRQVSSTFLISIWPILSRFKKKDESIEYHFFGDSGYREFGSSKTDIHLGLGASFISNNATSINIKPEIGVKFHLIDRFSVKSYYAIHIPTSGRKWESLNLSNKTKSELGIYLLISLNQPKRFDRPKSLFPKTVPIYRIP